MSIFNRTPLPKTPIRWDLSDFAGWAYDGVPSPDAHQAALEQGPEAHLAFLNRPRPHTLKNPEALREAFDHKADDIVSALQDLRSGFEAQVQNPDAEKLLGLFSDRLALAQAARLANYFCERYRDTFFKEPGTADFLEHVQQQWDEKVNPRFNALFDGLTLPEAAIGALTGKEPKLESHLRHLAPRPPRQESPAPARPEADDPDPRKADFRKLFMQINSSTDMPQEEKAALATKMFNAKAHQEWQAAASRGTTPLEAFSLQNGLTGSFTADYLENALELSRELAQKNAAFPQSHGTPPRYSWKEATDIVISAFSKFHPQMGDIAKTAIADCWVDTVADEKKRPGGVTYDMPYHVYSATRHSTALTHFTGDAYSVRTLAHELTHVISHYLANEAQPLQDGRLILPEGKEAVGVGRDGAHLSLPATTATPQNSAPPDALGEMLSHFSENLVHEEMLARCKSPGQRDILRQEERDETLHRITQEQAVFEHRLYAEISKAAAPLPQEEIISLMPGKTDSTTYQQALLGYYAGLPHLIINAPHYLLSYPLAELGAVNLSARYASLDEDSKKDFAEQWISVMRAGDQQNYGSVMREMGIDPNDAGKALAPVRALFQPPEEKRLSFVERLDEAGRTPQKGAVPGR